MPRIVLLLFPFCLIWSLFPRVCEGDDYTEWSYSQTIVLNTTASGSDVPNDVENTVILIRLNPGNFTFFSQTEDGGADIRFAKTDSTHLPYEIERWKDDTSGNNNDTAEIWVKVDTVFGDSISQSIIMYWGNPEATDSSDGAGVFLKDNEFEAVWHFSETPEEGVASFFDRVGEKTATPHGGMGENNRIAGQIGPGIDFDGVDDFCSTDFSSDAGTRTHSAWIYPRSSDDVEQIESVIDGDVAEEFGNGWGLDDGTIKVLLDDEFWTTGQTVSLNQWQHVAVAYDDDQAVLYYNGVPVDSLEYPQGDITDTYYNIGKSTANDLFFHGSVDELRIEDDFKSADWVRLCYENQRTGQSLVQSSGVFTWDTSSEDGFQAGSGTWGSDRYWTLDGNRLTAWPGRGYTARFTGGSGDEYTVTVNGTQYLDSMLVRSNYFTITGGTLYSSTLSALYISYTITTTIESVIAGSGGITKYGRGKLFLSGDNTYTGPTILKWGTVSTDFLADGGSSSNLGSSGNDAENLVIDSAVLIFTGEDCSCDRLFTVGTNGATITASGDGALDFSNTGTMGLSGSGDRTLTLNGENPDDNTLAAAIGESGGATSVTKGGVGRWILSGDNTYTGATTVSEGELVVNGTIDAGSDVTVAAGATIGGSGTIGGTVVSNGGTISPGDGAGKLTVGSLTLDSGSVIDIEVGTESDTLAVTGDLVLDGTITFIPVAGFAEDVPYRIITWGGDSTDNGIEITDDLPAGMDCEPEYGDGYLTVTFTGGLIKVEPEDTTVVVGEEISFAVSAIGEGTVTYLWQRERFPNDTDTVGNDSVCSIAAVEPADTNARFRCMVNDDLRSDISRWAHLTVIDTPRIAVQPEDVTVALDEKITLSVTVIDTVHCTYEWWKDGSETSLGGENSYTVDSADLDDSGKYFCLLESEAAEVSTDTVTVTVQPPPLHADFDFSPGSGKAPLTVTFTDRSTGNITSRTWNFGDESEEDTSTNPEYTYDEPGNYTVTLIVTGQDSSDTLIREEAVFVYGEGDNPLQITGEPVTGGDVIITISNIDDVDTDDPEPRCDSIGIWIRPDSLPRSADDEEASLIITYPESSLDDTVLIDKLTLPSTDSVFGLMTGIFWDDGSISSFSKANGCIVDLSDTSAENRVHIDSVYFDSLTASIRIAWCIDTDIDDADLDLGITYGFDKYPEEMSGEQTEAVLSRCSESVLELSEPLCFNTLYYVSVFVRSPDEEWSDPTESSRDTVRTGSPFREVVTFFDEESGDTVPVFDGRVILWKDTSVHDDAVTTDTLEVYSFEPPDGFTVAGTALQFLKGSPGPAFYIGIVVDSQFVDSIRNVRIYHFNDSDGVFTVNYSTVVDTDNGIVYVRTRDLRQPFIAMIDGEKPELSFLNQRDSIVHTDEDITDSIRISDNIANVRWWYVYGRGNALPSARDSGDTEGLHELLVPSKSQLISSDYGLRALLVISDGVFTDTFDMSRSVFRDGSDATTTEPLIWHPVYPTAHLDETDAKSLIIARVDKEDEEYDNRKIRLFRWVEYGGNGDEDDRWVEYDPDSKEIRSLFSLVPGRLLWLKTREDVHFDLGPAHTLSLIDTFEMELPPDEFTDFGMPFRFGIHIRDILDASGPEAESVYFYTWERDKKNDQYKCEPFYISTLPDYSDQTAVLEYSSPGGYTLYNLLDDTVTLRIPPTLATEDDDSGLGRKKGDESWSARLLASDDSGFEFPALCCGYVPGLKNGFFPLTPSFGRVRLFLFDRSTGKKQGHFFADDAKGGCAKELHIANASDSARTITYRLETAGRFPETFSSRLFDATSGRFTPDGTVTVPPHTTVSRWVVTGDAGFFSNFFNGMNRFRYGLQRLYPNPARSAVTIRYTVPLGARERLRITIFNFLGRKIWEKRIDRLLMPGVHLETWNGRDRYGRKVGAGRYPVRLVVLDGKGKTVKQFERCITYIP